MSEMAGLTSGRELENGGLFASAWAQKYFETASPLSIDVDWLTRLLGWAASHKASEVDFLSDYREEHRVAGAR